MPPMTGEPRRILATIPRTVAEIERAGAAIGLPVTAACMPGVVANLGVLAGHAATFLGDAGSLTR